MISVLVDLGNGTCLPLLASPPPQSLHGDTLGPSFQQTATILRSLKHTKNGLFCAAKFCCSDLCNALCISRPFEMPRCPPLLSQVIGFSLDLVTEQNVPAGSSVHQSWQFTNSHWLRTPTYRRFTIIAVFNCDNDIVGDGDRMRGS